ncbi:alanine racemase [Bacillus toyonensis]|uniref:alanine racemase n=1 Tax=Bacillus toyonensis TaxID=155322 RepID=UPI002E24C9FF|nr:alanine racemase [Bacillus toyonensis]
MSNKNYPEDLELNIGRPTQLVIDLKQYRENLRMIQSDVKTKIMAVIKANAYGHGIASIAKAGDDLVDFFGVAVLEEAMQVRVAGVLKPILVLGFVNPNQLPYVVSKGIHIPIYSYEQWLDWKEEIRKYDFKENLCVHLKINSGMNRLGFKDESELLKVVNEIELESGVDVKGVFTHFATADIPGHLLIEKQEKTFLSLINKIDTTDVIVHIANSAYSMSRNNANLFDMVRVGASSYGILPDPSLKNSLSVLPKPILKLVTRIVAVQKLMPGEHVGYGATFKAEKHGRIGIIPIGYADGLLRRYSKESYVLINGEKRKLVGRICMDQAMVLLEDEDTLWDEVVIYGKQKEKEITLEMAGEWSDTINYEIACLLSERIKRVYK